MPIRRKLFALIAPLLLAPVMLAVGPASAHAAITDPCESLNVCDIHEDMGSGFCAATVEQTGADAEPQVDGNFVKALAVDNNTGYTCNFFLQRNVNGTGWYNINSASIQSGGPLWESPNQWNGQGYGARVCLQFNWGSSLGDMHCSKPVFI